MASQVIYLKHKKQTREKREVMGYKSEPNYCSFFYTGRTKRLSYDIKCKKYGSRWHVIFIYSYQIKIGEH